jgi:zinc protease
MPPTATGPAAAPALPSEPAPGAASEPGDALAPMSARGATPAPGSAPGCRSGSVSAAAGAGTGTGTGTLERFTLPNGLRVVLAPEPGLPVAGVAVHYDVGFRSEPPGRAGFAHLFEHLLFQGGARQDAGSHARAVELAGGRCNAATGPDATDFHQVFPAGSLEHVLALEADRMRGPRLTEETLRTQIGVVTEEIRRNITGRPYGGFPKFALPPLLYRTYPNTHDGYGDTARLGDADLDGCAAFFDRHYAPGNAVLTVAGGFAPAEARRLIARHFAALPARPVPARASFDETEPDMDVCGTHTDPLAPLPAVAVGYRLPDPARDLPGYLAHVLLAAVLEQRLRHRLVLRAGTAVAVTAACGLIGGPFNARHPVTLAVTVTHTDASGADEVLAALDAELAALASAPDPTPAAESAGPWSGSLTGPGGEGRPTSTGPGGEGGPAANGAEDEGALTADGLRLAARPCVSALLRRHDHLLARLRSLGACELLYGDASLHRRLPALLTAVEPAAVIAAARRLRDRPRAVLTLIPGAESGRGTAPGPARPRTRATGATR